MNIHCVPIENFKGTCRSVHKSTRNCGVVFIAIPIQGGNQPEKNSQVLARVSAQLWPTLTLFQWIITSAPEPMYVCI